jgi:hypothetical protein
VTEHPAPDRSGRPAAILRDRLILAAAVVGLLASLALHGALLAGLAAAPVAPWSWGLHATSVVLFWLTARRVTAAGLTGVRGLLRIRRMVPIPARLCLGAATANALAAAWLTWSGRAIPGRAGTAYWIMMYGLVAILRTFVLRRPPGAAEFARGGGRLL